MSWTTPTIRTTGELITASIWNTDLVDNLAFLKGEAGLDIDFEDDIKPSAGTERCGLSTAPWEEGHFNKLFGGPRYSVHRFVRRQHLPMTILSTAGYQMEFTSGGSGSSHDRGGSNQLVLSVTENATGHAYIGNEAEQNNAQDTSFNVSRSPYIRVEFATNRPTSSYPRVFLGFRESSTSTLIPVTGENFAGLALSSGVWYCYTGDGVGQDVGGSEAISANTRYVIEILITSTAVEFYLNGVLVETLSSNPPSGGLEWQCLIESPGGGGADVARLTVADLDIQEDLS